MKAIIEQPDGTIHILIPADGVDILVEIERLKLTGTVVIADDQIPTDRYFRNAWVKGTGKVDVDMPKARDIHMGHIRKVRDEKLKALDAEYMIALEKDKTSDKASIAAKKQTLRDLPTTYAATLAAATTPEALKALWPSELV